MSPPASLSLVLFLLPLGCGRPAPPVAVPLPPQSEAAPPTQPEATRPKTGKTLKDLTKEVEAELAKKPVRGSLPSFDEKEMVRPVSKIDGFEVADYRKLPNCLTVFRDCHAVPFADKTSARYLADILAVAKKPCRVVL